MPAKRVEWIDFCRIYAAFCVIVRHNERYAESFYFFSDLFNYRSLIFFFFLIAGYFTHRAEKGKLVDWQRTKHLLWPYLFWAAFAVCALMPLLHLPEIEAGDWKWLTFGLFVREMGLASWTYWDLSNVPLWFLKTLIIFAFVSPLLQRLPLKAMLGVILFCFAANDVLCHADPATAEQNGYEGVEWLPFRLYESTLALGFYAGGLLIRRYADTGQLTAFMRAYAWMPVVASIILLPGVYYWHFQPPVRSSALVLLGVATTMSIGVLFERFLPRVCSFVARGGRAAFFVYVTHYILLKCMKMVCTGNYRGTLSREEALYAPWLILAVSLGVYCLLKRFFPRFMRLFCLS